MTLTTCVLTVLVGPTCSGKTTRAHLLESSGDRRIITYTTRPRRMREKDGKDYHFISYDEFMQKWADGDFLEVQSYSTVEGMWHYGTPVKDILHIRKNSVIVLTPSGARAVEHFIRPDVLVRTVYLDIPYETCLERAIARGDNPEEFKRRWDEDLSEFEEFKKNPLITIEYE